MGPVVENLSTCVYVYGMLCSGTVARAVRGAWVTNIACHALGLRPTGACVESSVPHRSAASARCARDAVQLPSAAPRHRIVVHLLELLDPGSLVHRLLSSVLLAAPCCSLAAESYKIHVPALLHLRY